MPYCQTDASIFNTETECRKRQNIYIYVVEALFSRSVYDTLSVLPINTPYIDHPPSVKPVLLTGHHCLKHINSSMPL